MKQNLRRIYFFCTVVAGVSFLPFCLNAQNYQWAKKFARISGYGGPSGIAVDAPGNVYTIGSLNGTYDFDPGAGTANLSSTEGIYVSKLTVAGNYSWAKLFSGSASNQWGMAIAVDASSNVYVTGAFSGTVDFDPGPATLNFTSNGVYDVFVCKLNSAGNLVWAKRFGGTGADWGQSISVDASGNPYITGVFEGTVDFDPNATTFNMTAVGIEYDIYVNKLSTTGTFVWARKMGGSGNDQGLCSALDASGNIHVAGSFDGTADFDPGASTFNLTASGPMDIYIAKLSSTGAFVWARKMGGTDYDQANSIAIDGSGNVITVGYFYQTADFDPGVGVANLTSAGNQEIFISKLNSSGNYVWAKRIGSANLEYDRGVDADAAGNIYYTGVYWTAMDFDPGAGTYNLTPSGTDFFISKLNSAGNHQWTRSLGGTGSDGSNALTTDVYGNIYTTGSFSGTVDFNPGTATNNLTSTGSSDTYVLKLSHPNPLPIELLRFDAKTGEDKSILCDWTTATETNNDFFTIERSKDGIEFEEAGRINGAGNSTQTLSYTFEDKHPYSGTSCYRLKQTDFDGQFSYSDIISVKLKGDNQLYIYPNPAQDHFSILWPEENQSVRQVKMYDITGRLVLSYSETDNAKRSTTIYVNTFPKGIYIVQLTHDNLVEQKRIVIQ